MDQSRTLFVWLGARLRGALSKRSVIVEAIDALPNFSTPSTLAAQPTAQPAACRGETAAATPVPGPDSAAKKPRKKRASRPTPALDEILQAQFLTVKLAPLRYPGTSESVWRHRIFKTEPERREAQLQQREPRGLAKCFKRQGTRGVVLDCRAYDAHLNSQE